jgi:zinc protease
MTMGCKGRKKHRSGTACLVLLALLVVPARAAGPGRHVLLDNGLQVFLYEKRDLPLVHIVVGFNVGSKDESEATSGLVHLLEHCLLFRGSATRPGSLVAADIRRHGAYLNGNTGQDLSVFEISLPAENADFGLNNQKDILFGPSLSQDDVNTEKEIILEEYSQMEDDPERVASDLVLQALFQGHPYGRSVYGRREVIAAATAEELRDFHQTYFVPDNAAIALVGDFSAVDMERLVRQVFGSLPKSGRPPKSFPMAPPLKKSSSRRLERDVREGYLVLAFPAPDYNGADRYAVSVLVEALGRGVNPLLAAFLRGQRDSVQNVSMSYLPLLYGGAAVVSVKANPRDLAAVERLAENFLKRVHGASFSSRDFPSAEAQMAAFDYLEMAKNQIRFASGQAEESGLQLAGAFVRHMLLNTRADAGPYLEAIGRVDSGDLRKVAARYLGRGDCAAVSIVPLAEKKK